MKNLLLRRSYYMRMRIIGVRMGDGKDMMIPQMYCLIYFCI